MKKALFYVLIVTLLCTVKQSNAQCGYVAPPVGQKDTILLKAAVDPNGINVKAVGTNLKWYSDSLKTISLGTGSLLNYYIDNSNVPDSLTFYVTQTLAGCESKPDNITWHFIKCPLTAPATIGISACENDPMLYTTSLRATTIQATTSWQWYDASKTPLAVGTSSDYNPFPYFYLNLVGRHIFYVNYSAIEPITGQACFSPLALVQYEIFPKPSPKFLGLNSNYCYTDGIIYLQGQDSSAHPGNDQFTVNGILNNSNTIQTVTLLTKTDTVKYLRTTTYGCRDSISKIITIHY